MAEAVWRGAPATLLCVLRGRGRSKERWKMTERLPGPKFLTVPKGFGTKHPDTSQTRNALDGRTLASANVMKR